jgi:hypothetical protein
VLAHSFLGLAESFRTFLDEQLPRLRDERLSCNGVNDLLIEISEEFRHILYHVRIQSVLRTCAIQKAGTGRPLVVANDGIVHGVQKRHGSS